MLFEGVANIKHAILCIIHRLKSGVIYLQKPQGLVMARVRFNSCATSPLSLCNAKTKCAGIYDIQSEIYSKMF